MMRRTLLLIFSISILLLLFLPNVNAQTGIYPAPILLEPTNGQELGREAVTFKWAWEGELAEDEYFRVEVWELQMEPTNAPLRLTRSTSLSVLAADLSPGDYQWRVTVVRVDKLHPKEELSEPSETWSFSWGQAIPSPTRELGKSSPRETQPSRESETIAGILAWITGNISGTLAWVKKDIVRVLVYATVGLGSIAAIVLLSVYSFVAEPNQMRLRAALGLVFNRKELVLAFTSKGNYLNERWKDWEQIIDEEIDNVLLYGKSPHVIKADSLERIPGTSRKYALHRYYEEHREEDSLDYLPEKFYGYAGLGLADISAIVSPWKSMINYLDSRNERERSMFKRWSAMFIETFARTVRSVKIEEDEYTHDYMHGYLLRMPTLRIQIPRFIPVVFLQKTHFTEEDVARIVDFVKNFGTEHFLAILITCDPPKHEGRSAYRLQRLINGSPYAEDFLILSLIDDILHVLRAKDKSHRFVQTIVSRRSLSAVSPYVIAGPVPEGMFFGRDQEIRLILEGAARNFAIVGGRKIGKTSTLQQVRRRLEKDPRHSTFYLDCQAIRTYQDFFNAVGKKVGRSFEDDPANFHSVASLLRRESGDRPIVFMIDEIDDILDYDVGNGERLFKTFRALSHEGDCCFGFCGSKTLYQRIHHPKSPFFNFCTYVPLGELDKESAEEIIIRPMNSMNVQLDGGVVHEIIRVSSRHPNFIQYICHSLIEHIASHGSRRITLEDLELITTRRDFCEYFVTVAWGEATPLEKLITLLMLDRPSFAKDDVYVALEKHGLRDRRAIDQALETLEVYYFLIKGPRLYHLAWSEFPRIITKVQNVGELRRSLLWQMRKG